MAYNFLPCDRNQSYLLPLSLRDWLPDGHLAWFVLDAVEQLDLQPFSQGQRATSQGFVSRDFAVMCGGGTGEARRGLAGRHEDEGQRVSGGEPRFEAS